MKARIENVITIYTSGKLSWLLLVQWSFRDGSFASSNTNCFLGDDVNLMWYNITGRTFNCPMAVEVLEVLRRASKRTLKYIQ